METLDYLKNNRLPEFDILKGYLVFFVIGLHLLTNFFEVLGINVFMGWQLPLFFWASGYFLKFIPFKEQLKKRILSVAIPFFTYFIIFTLIVGTYGLVTKTMTISILARSIISELFGQPILDLIDKKLFIMEELHTSMTTFWYYIQYMYAILIAFPLLYYINYSVRKAVLVITALLLLSCLGYGSGIDFTLYSNLAFFEAVVIILGNIEGKNKLHEKLYNLNKYQQIILFIVSFLIAAVFCYLNTGITYMSYGAIGSHGMIDPITAFIQVLSGSIAMLLLAKATLKLKFISMFLTYLSENMMDIVILHMFVAWALYRFFNLPIGKEWFRSDDFTGDFWQCAMIVGIFILNMFICFIIIKIKKVILCKIEP